MKVDKATKTDLTARVYPKTEAPTGTPAGKYLGVQIQGGKRRQKTIERAFRHIGVLRDDEWILPGRALNLDQYGNITKTVFKNILTGLKTRGSGYFIPPAGSGLARGVWKRPVVLESQRSRARTPGRTAARATRHNSIEMVLLFINPTNYPPKYEFDKVAEVFVERNLLRIWDDEFRRAMATAR